MNTLTGFGGRAFHLGCLGFASVLALAACTGAPGKPGSDNDAAVSVGDESELRTVNLGVTYWPVLPSSVPYQVAIEKGFFEDHGIYVDADAVISSDGGGTTTRAFLGSDQHFAEVATPAVVNAIDAGAELLAVSPGISAVAELLWIADKDSGIEDINDLKGKDVAYTNPGSVTESVLALALEEAGIANDELELVSSGGTSNGLTLLANGAVDATNQSTADFNVDPQGTTIVFRAADLLPEFSQSVLVTTPQIAQDDPELVADFVAARTKAVEFMLENPEETVDIWVKYGGIEPDIAESAKELLTAGEWGLGFTEESLRFAERGMEAAGLIDAGQKVEWSEVITQEFLPDHIGTISLDW